MAVFTEVKPEDLDLILNTFGLGDLIYLEGIHGGIENTNYFLDTQIQGSPVKHWVLTLFENLSDEDLPFFNLFTQHLEKAGLHVPAPLVNSLGESLFRLNGRSAVIVPKLAGSDLKVVDTESCAQVGRWLAKMHSAQADFSLQRPLVRNLAWMETHYAHLKETAVGEDLVLLRTCIDRYCQHRELLERCPQGTVHGDMFRDNVLFDGGGISGVIDFYHACDATLLFDLAVCANDWCADRHGAYDKHLLDALINAYKEIRAWTDVEEQAWPYCLEVAALRFWISRLVSKYVGSYQHTSIAGNTIKNPDEMKALLLTLLSNE